MLDPDELLARAVASALDECGVARRDPPLPALGETAREGNWVDGRRGAVWVDSSRPLSPAGLCQHTPGV